MTIKLVALDLDGTLVNDALEVSQRTMDVLTHLIHETSVRVVIATGRMYPSAIPFAQRLGIREPIIAYQGALIRDHTANHQTLHHAPISLSVARRLIALLREETFHTNLYVNDQLFTNSTQEYADYYAKISGVRPTVIGSLADALTAPPTKLMVIDETRIDGLLNTLRDAFPQELSVCKSRHNFCEMIDMSASKWNAIQVLAKQWGIADAEIMAIGDHGNDYSMISQAGLGVAMGNAPTELQQVATYVTGSIHEDGAADAIERFVINGATLPVMPVRRVAEVTKNPLGPV